MDLEPYPLEFAREYFAECSDLCWTFVVVDWAVRDMHGQAPTHGWSSCGCCRALVPPDACCCCEAGRKRRTNA